MTLEQLSKANELIKDIKEIESFKKEFNNDYVNYIKAKAEKGDKWIYVFRGDELHTLINNYIDKRLKELKAELENL